MCDGFSSAYFCVVILWKIQCVKVVTLYTFTKMKKTCFTVIDKLLKKYKLKKYKTECAL